MAVIAKVPKDVQYIAIVRLLVDTEQQQASHSADADADAELMGQA